MPIDPFEKIDREESLSAKIENQLRDAILKKVFLPGDKLPGEMQLAEKFGVSRTAVREAIRILAGRGLVEIHKGSGIYVAEVDESNVVDPFYQLLQMKSGNASLGHLIHIREFLEPECARMAASNCSDDDIQYLGSMLEQMKAHQQKYNEMIQYDIRFHRRIALATHNPIIPVIMEPMFKLLHKFITTTYPHYHAPELAIKYHEGLLKAIQKRDGEEAFQLMKEHLRVAEEHLNED